jgi:hypothetical protein
VDILLCRTEMIWRVDGVTAHSTVPGMIFVILHRSTVNPKRNKDPIKSNKTKNEFVLPDFSKIAERNTLYCRIVGLGDMP